MSPKWPSGELRKVVCVGHDVKQDIALLKSINFDVYEMSNLLEVVDNQKLHQHRNRFYNGQGLSVVLAGLDISYMYLHNAGNDAVYTLQSLLRLAVLKRQESLVRGPKDNTALVPIHMLYMPSQLADQNFAGLFQNPSPNSTRDSDGARGARTLTVASLSSRILGPCRIVSKTPSASGGQTSMVT